VKRKTLRRSSSTNFHLLFQVQDPDNKNGLTQIHTCSLVNSRNGDEDAFHIAQIDQRNLLRIKSNKILDFETKKVYNITVFCKDTNLGISKLLLIEVTGIHTNLKPWAN
jgi:hypothetical protein